MHLCVYLCVRTYISVSCVYVAMCVYFYVHGYAYVYELELSNIPVYLVTFDI